MKRPFKIIAISAGILLLCSFFYLKGHADGIRRSRISNMRFDISCLHKLERGQVDRAKSDQALFVWAALKAESEAPSWFTEWKDWSRMDTDDNFERLIPQAEAIVSTYQHTFLSAEQIETTLEQKFGVPVKSTTK